MRRADDQRMVRKYLVLGNDRAKRRPTLRPDLDTVEHDRARAGEADIADGCSRAGSPRGRWCSLSRERETDVGVPNGSSAAHDIGRRTRVRGFVGGRLLALHAQQEIVGDHERDIFAVFCDPIGVHEHEGARLGGDFAGIRTRQKSDVAREPVEFAVLADGRGTPATLRTDEPAEP